jgi:hypothetical protein
MKRLMVVALVGLLAASLMSPGAALAGKKKKKKKATRQELSGGILMMAPFFNDLDACYSGLHRRAAVMAGDDANGFVGFHFDVDPGTIGKVFNLEVTGGEGDVDLDITYYTELGTQEQATDTSYAPPNYSFEERKPGGEAGVIPKGVKWTKAIVCMHTGQNATFDYVAGRGVKLPAKG